MKSSPTSTRHAQQHEGDDNAHFLLRSPQSSFQTLYGVGTPTGMGSSTPSRFQSSPSSLNASTIDFPYYVNDGSPYPSSAPFSPAESQSELNPKKQNQRHSFPPPVSEGSKTAAASSPHSKSHYFLPSMFKRLNPTLVLQNSGSVARDHLASERTFLSYVRTSIGLAGAGVGIVQLFTVAELTSRAANIPELEVNRRMYGFSMALGTLSLLFALFVLIFGEWISLFVPGCFIVEDWGLVIFLVFSCSCFCLFVWPKLTVKYLKVCIGISRSSVLFPKTCFQQHSPPL